MLIVIHYNVMFRNFHLLSPKLRFNVSTNNNCELLHVNGVIICLARCFLFVTDFISISLTGVGILKLVFTNYVISSLSAYKPGNNPSPLIGRFGEANRGSNFRGNFVIDGGNFLCPWLGRVYSDCCSVNFSLVYKEKLLVIFRRELL